MAGSPFLIGRQNRRTRRKVYEGRRTLGGELQNINGLDDDSS